MEEDRTKFSPQFLLSKTQEQLRSFCKRRKIPYLNLNKKKLTENIVKWQNGATKLDEFPHKGLHNRELQNIKGRRITIKIRRFCFEYSTKGEALTQKKWGERFGVSGVTISKWLKSEKVQELIKTFQESYEDRIMQKFADNEEAVFNQLMNVINQRRNTDVKRKAINDYFGYRGRVNINETKNNTTVNVNQDQKTNAILAVQNNINLTEEEIIAEIKELEELE